MHTVIVPNRFTKDTMGSLINNVISSDLEPKNKSICFDFNNLNFIEPSGVTILGNIFEWLKARGVEIDIAAPKSVRTGKHSPLLYLDDSKFFKRYVGRTLYNQNAAVRNTTLELENVTYSNSFQWLESKFAPWLAREMGNLQLETVEPIRMCFGEIFNNIKDHAQENIGCIFAQHYPKINEIHISISDFGIGIPNNIRKIEPSLTDAEAMEKAIEEGYSSKSTPQNRGAGLFTLKKNVVENYGGKVYIQSFHGILECEQNNLNEVWVNSKHGNSIYPGTFIEVILDTRNFEDEITDNEEEFKWDL